jgi:hypothetical protein
MSYTTDYNIPLMPSGPVDWPALFNDLANKVEAGRTLKLTAAVTIAIGTCFYINSSGKASKSTSSSDIAGIWQTSSTTINTQGYGQIDGTITNGGWSWTPGDFLYSDANGVLTSVESSSKLAIARALTATKIVILRRDDSSSAAGNVVGPATNTDSYIPQWDGTNSETLKNGIPIEQLLDGRDVVEDDSPSSITMDYEASASHWLELTGDKTITITNMNDGARMVIILKQGSGGSKLVTSWTGVDYWQDGGAPTLTTTAGHFDIVTLIKSNGKVFAAASLDFS